MSVQPLKLASVIGDGKRTPSEIYRDRITEQTEGKDSGWIDAGMDYLRYVSANLAAKTAEYYTDRLVVAAVWMLTRGRGGDGVPIADFHARDLREYIEYRQKWRNPETGRGLSDSTRRGDAIAMKVFMEFCATEGYIEGGDPLKDYRIPKGKRVFTKRPTAEEVGRILAATLGRWDIKANPKMRFVREKERAFFAARNYAIIATLADSSARIGEVLEALLEDYDRENMCLMLRETKGDEPRPVQFGSDARDAIDRFLALRRRVNSPYLFCTMYGTKIEYKPFLHSWRDDCAWAGLKMNLHHLRHYSTTEVAHHNVLAARDQAGHKSTTTTMRYVHRVPKHVQDAHTAARPLAQAIETVPILVNKRSERQRERRKKAI